MKLSIIPHKSLVNKSKVIIEKNSLFYVAKVTKSGYKTMGGDKLPKNSVCVGHTAHVQSPPMKRKKALKHIYVAPKWCAPNELVLTCTNKKDPWFYPAHIVRTVAPNKFLVKYKEFDPEVLSIKKKGEAIVGKLNPLYVSTCGTKGKGINFIPRALVHRTCQNPWLEKVGTMLPKYKDYMGDTKKEKIEVLQEIWYCYNQMHFNGQMSLPNIRFLKKQRIDKMRKRGHWWAARNELAFVERIFNLNKKHFAYIFLHEMCHQAVSRIDSYVCTTQAEAHGEKWQAWMKKVDMPTGRYDIGGNDSYSGEEDKYELDKYKKAQEKQKDKVSKQDQEMDRLTQKVQSEGHVAITDLHQKAIDIKADTIGQEVVFLLRENGGVNKYEGLAVLYHINDRKYYIGCATIGNTSSVVYPSISSVFLANSQTRSKLKKDTALYTTANAINRQFGSVRGWRGADFEVVLGKYTDRQIQEYVKLLYSATGDQTQSELQDLNSKLYGTEYAKITRGAEVGSTKTVYLNTDVAFPSSLSGINLAFRTCTSDIKLLQSYPKTPEESQVQIIKTSRLLSLEKVMELFGLPKSEFVDRYIMLPDSGSKGDAQGILTTTRIQYSSIIINPNLYFTHLKDWE